MVTRHSLVAIAATAVLGAALPATAQQPPAAGLGAAKGPGPEPSKGTAARRSQLAGDELFTPEERKVFFDRMKAAKTPEERAKIQAERQATAEVRAKEKGIALPEPAARAPTPGVPKAAQ
jgi:hypothetical protein